MKEKIKVRKTAPDVWEVTKEEVDPRKERRKESVGGFLLLIVGVALVYLFSRVAHLLEPASKSMGG